MSKTLEQPAEVDLNRVLSIGEVAGWEQAAKALDEDAVAAWRQRDYRKAETLREAADKLAKRGATMRSEHETHYRKP